MFSYTGLTLAPVAAVIAQVLDQGIEMKKLESAVAAELRDNINLNCVMPSITGDWRV